MKCRICILTTDSGWGGTEKMIHTLAKGLVKHSCMISLVTLTGDGTLLARTSDFCERMLDLKIHFPWNPWALWKLFSFLRKGHFHVLHTCLFHANILGRFLGRILRIPVVISSQWNVDTWRRPRHIWLDRWTSSGCDLVISNSLAGKRRLESVENIHPEKIEVVHSGLDLSELPSKRNISDSRRRWNIPEGIVIGMVANFRAHKGHSYFIKAAEMLCKVRSDLFFVIAGEGVERQRCEAQVRSQGLEERLYFLGSVANIYEALNAIDIFVLSSEWEGFPISILEAMAFCVPVIATNVGGVAEVVKHGETGILVPSKDPSAIKEAVLKLLADPALRETLVQNARREVFENFTQEKMVRETVEIYERLLKKKGVHA